MDAGRCLCFAILGGLATSASNNVISFAQHRFPERASERWCSAALFAANIILNLAGIACFLAGAKYGPVAVVMPILTASKLLSSMCFQIALRLEKYTKDKRVGTMVLSFSAMCLVEVGPTDPDGDPDVLAMLSTPLALGWLLALALALLGALLEYHSGKESGGETEMILLSTVVAVSTALGASVGKILSITEGAALALSVVCYLACGVMSFLYAASAAFTCDMSVFMPVSECLQLLVNCATGLFIWGDGVRIRGKLSYAMVYLLISLGVYLCSSFDVFADRKQALPVDTVGERLTQFVPRKKGAGLLHATSPMGEQVRFKRQRHILREAIDSSHCRRDVREKLHEELLRRISWGILDKDELEELTGTLRSSTELAEEMLETFHLQAGRNPLRKRAVSAMAGEDINGRKMADPLLHASTSGSFDATSHKLDA
mmetsp:Transcript_94728/g.282915  ORF Transcript_94728/g.282915 Transcript_94728/m.282915 type:complete len:431 (-) Transcript_94728:146-1438(-)